MSTREVNQIISEYFESTIKSVGVLYKEGLYEQTLIIVFSAIDSFGLLDAPEEQQNATGNTFKEWVKKYIIGNDIEYTELDLWSSRCAILHTFTTQSDLSKKGKAREILFYSGNSASDKANDFSVFAHQINNGNHVAASIEKTVRIFLSAVPIFARDLDKKCTASNAYLSRLRKILHQHHW